MNIVLEDLDTLISLKGDSFECIGFVEEYTCGSMHCSSGKAESFS